VNTNAIFAHDIFHVNPHRLFIKR